VKWAAVLKIGKYALAVVPAVTTTKKNVRPEEGAHVPPDIREVLMCLACIAQQLFFQEICIQQAHARGRAFAPILINLVGWVHARVNKRECPTIDQNTSEHILCRRITEVCQYVIAP
jgi:hypothetical protein